AQEPEASSFLPAKQPPAEPKRKPEPVEEPEPLDEQEDEPEEEKAAQEERINLPAVVPEVQLPATWDIAFDAMNKRHAIIESYGGKTVIASWEPSPIDPRREIVVFQKKDSFLLRYLNRQVKTELPDGKGGYKYLRQPL